MTTLRRFMFAAMSALACSTDQTATGSQLKAVTDTVRVEELSFRPDSLDVDVGAGVVFMNDGETHDVLFVGAGAPPDIPRGQRWNVERRFLMFGRVAYLCSIHSTMTGVIQVRVR